MVDLQHIGTETSLAELYPKIDAFYENDLKHHRIHVSDNLFLSALELEAPAYKTLLTLWLSLQVELKLNISTQNYSIT